MNTQHKPTEMTDDELARSIAAVLLLTENIEVVVDEMSRMNILVGQLIDDNRQMKKEIASLRMYQANGWTV